MESTSPAPQAGRGKTIQARVDAAYARRFQALAAARGMSESALVRSATDAVMVDAEKEIEALRMRLRERHREEEQALDDLASAVVSDGADLR